MKDIDVGKKIRAIMVKKGLSQVDLAKTTGISQPVISEMIRGRRNILPLVDAFSEHFGYSREKLLGEDVAEKSYNTGVPYYDVDFVGGFDEIINDQTIIPSYLINFKPYEKATCWCNITGHSMEPEINHGDIIALRRIEDCSFLAYGEIYAIVTRNDMRTVKRLGPGPTKDSYMMIPSNKSPEYAPQEIRKEDILYVYEVMGCMKRF